MRKIEIKGITYQELARILFGGDIEFKDGDLIQTQIIDENGDYDHTITYRFDAKWDTPDYLQYQIVPDESESPLCRIEPIDG